HRLNDFATYIFASRDFGQSWQTIKGDLPAGEVARTITEDLKNPDVLYLGTERGLYVSVDRGKQWLRVKGSLPTVPIYEITLHPRDNAMLLATHGRGIWVLDDMTPFQRFAEARGKDAYLFAVKTAAQMNPAGDRSREFEGDAQFLGKNPELGAALAYHLKAAAKTISLIVKDASGNIVRELSGDRVKDKNAAGINTVLWDLRVEPLPTPRPQPGQPAGGGGGGGFGGGGLGGPFVMPGQYSVTLKVEDKEAASQPFTVQGDPDITIAEADRKAAYDAAMELHQLQKRFNAASDAVTAMNERFRAIQTAAKDNKDATGLRTKLEAFGKKAAPTNVQFGANVADAIASGNFEGLQRSLRFRISGLKGGIMASTSRPTEVQMRQLGEIKPALDKVIGEANGLIGELNALAKEAAESGVYPTAVKPIQQ
ncbi:MAG: hypothetical protein HOP19_13725, partial [Acidobacteria bacterium]|nr:hypothetical protein [Acidobacteriota bacterium]